jgi:ATPase subunit of ABC transporter with duplicated ATPase domains
MPSIENADRVIDELCGSNAHQRVPRDKIFKAAEQAKIVPDVMYYFNHLPEKYYSKQELIDELNRMVRERDRVKEVGVFGSSMGGKKSAQAGARKA